MAISLIDKEHLTIKDGDRKENGQKIQTTRNTQYKHGMLKFIYKEEVLTDPPETAHLQTGSSLQGRRTSQAQTVKRLSAKGNPGYLMRLHMPFPRDL